MTDEEAMAEYRRLWTRLAAMTDEELEEQEAEAIRAALDPLWLRLIRLPDGREVIDRLEDEARDAAGR